MDIFAGSRCNEYTWGSIMFFKSKKLLGIDIGTNSVKVVELNVGSKSSTVLNFLMEPVPPGLVQGGEVTDPAALAGIIRAAVSKLGTKRRKAAVPIWGAAVIVKKITLPRMEEKLVAEQIQWEAEQYIPFDKSEINLEFQILNTKKNVESMDVLIVGAKKDLVFRVAEAVALADLDCEVVDVAGFALANCYHSGVGKTPGEVTGIINVGGGVTNFVVVDGGDVIFSRDIPSGGGTYTAEIQKNMGLSYEESESMKLSACMGQAAPAEIQEVISAVNESMADEVKRTFEFFQATTTDVSVQRFVVTGGASQTPGLRDAIGRALGMGLQEFNPFERIAIEGKTLNQTYLKQMAPFAAVAVGLGLREAGDR